jgi:hypothetical protein
MNGSQKISSYHHNKALFWLIGFLAIQMVCQIALLIPAFSMFRAIFRTAAFGISLLALVGVSGYAPWLTIYTSLALSLSIVVMSIFHTSTNTPLAGLAQTMLYLAIMAPAFWVARLRIDTKVFYSLIGFLWFFHTISATVGVLQTLYPGQFEMERSSVIRGTVGEDGLKITLADGSVIFRPSGLTDAPGGASSAGFLAYLFGLGFLATSKRLSLQLLSAPAIAIGLYCIVISQVRVNFVLAAIGTVVFCIGMVVQGRTGIFMRLFVFLPIIVFASILAAFTIGGEGSVNRLSTLFEESPQKVYASNRGAFLEETFKEHLPNYPFGAGLGRWGMNRAYFGDETNPDSPGLWVEIQFTAWVFDGGLALLIFYSSAVLLATFKTFLEAIRCPDPWLATWGLLVVGYDVALIATLFSYVPFIGQMGLEFWLFNAAYWATVRCEKARQGVGQ